MTWRAVKGVELSAMREDVLFLLDTAIEGRRVADLYDEGHEAVFTVAWNAVSGVELSMTRDDA